MTGNEAAGLTVIGLAAFWLFGKRRPMLVPGVSDTATGVSNPYVTRQVRDFATAIARAEGFYVPGSIPQRANNPGNLKSPTWTYAGEREGSTLGAGIVVFATADAGWAALHRQIGLILSGESNVYSLNMTIRDMARVWTGAEPIEADAWASNVALAYGTSPNTRLAEALA